MAASPVKILILITLVTIFNALLIGATAEEEVFTPFQEPESDGFFATLEALLAIVQAVWDVVTLVFDAITFNIDGAPFYIRFPLGAIMGFGLVWSIATLIRGN